MSQGPLESHVDVFAERNHFLFAWLGVVSAKHRLSALLSRHSPGPGVARAIDPSHPFLLALLGLASLASRAHAEVERWASESAPPSTDADEPREPCLRRLLQ